MAHAGATLKSRGPSPENIPGTPFRRYMVASRSATDLVGGTFLGGLSGGVRQTETSFDEQLTTCRAMEEVGLPENMNFSPNSICS